LGALLVDFDQISQLEDNGVITNLTIITPRDGDEDGFHQRFHVHNNKFTFCSLTSIPVSETPMYVVLNVAEDEEIHNICSIVHPTIREASCNSLNVEWAGSYSAFPQDETKPSSVDIYVTEGGQDFDIADEHTGFVIADFPFNRNQYNIGNLKAETEYTVHLIYKWLDGSIQVCDVDGATNNQLCRLNQEIDFTISYNNGQSNSSAANAFNYEGTGCGDWGDDDHDGYINGLDWDADGDGNLDANKEDNNHDGIVDLWEAPNKIWSSFPLNGVAPNVVVNFKSNIDLQSISFLHAKGVGHIKIEFKNCDCPNEDWVLYKEIDLSGYMNWYHLGMKPTGRKISKLRFTINYDTGANLGISMLSFCGESGGDCWLADH